VPTNKQRRQAAQRHLQRQLERRAELTRKRRRNALIGATIAAVVVVVVAGLLIAGVFSGNGKKNSASGSTATSAAAATTAADGSIACNFTAGTSGTNPNLKDVGLPPNADKIPTKGTDTLKMSTNQGGLTLTLNRSAAPCAAASFTYLASKNFFANSPCHREVNQPTFGVLQCGDPTGTGQGGPSYTFREEANKNTKYPRGTIAMANSGQPNSTASQFFLCFTDTDLPPNYSAVGTVDQAGLAVLDKIAAAGNDGSFEPSPGGGKPKLPVTVTSITVAGS
jgi:cyclophilin family peptidyl-prolyl cis-trans isomerase